MDKNKRLVKLGAVIIVFLALGLAFMRTSSVPSRASGPRPLSARERAEMEERRALETLKKQEMLGVAEDETNGLTKEQKRALAVERYVRRPDLAAGSPNYSLDTDSLSRYPYASLPSTSAGGEFPSNTYKPQGLGRTDYGKYASSSSSNAAPSAGPANPGVYRPTTDEKMKAERERAFAPYMASMNKDQQKKLEGQLKGLSAGIDRAVAKALLPKNKKDANIEKYLSRHASPSAAAAGPFADVIEQVQSQKAGVVNSMGSAFGSKAAKEAGQVMDSFSKELSSAVSAPGQTPQQTAEKVRNISEKYQQKLEKMSRDNGFNQFEQERVAKDNLLKEELAKQYDSTIMSEAGKIIDAARMKDMTLARQGLPAEEYYKQQLANQRERRKNLEDLMAKNNKSAKGLFTAEDQVENKTVEQALEKEESGQTLAKRYQAGPKELAAIDQSLGQERNEKIKTAGEIYGPDGARKIDGIYQKYYNDYMKIWQDPETSRTYKQQQSMELRQGVNKDLEEAQKDPALRKARLDNQVTSVMKQNPGLKDEHRPALETMFERINQVAESNLPDAEKQIQIQKAQEDFQKKVNGQ